MAGWVCDNVLDQGINYIDVNATRLDICQSGEPTSYTEATANPATGDSLGNKTSINITACEDSSPSGRQVEIQAITDGSVTYTGTAVAWALTDGVSELIATGLLDASEGVTSGNTFTLNAFTIRIPDIGGS